MMTDAQCKELRRTVGVAVIDAQNYAKKQNCSEEDIMAEIIMVLLSLAGFISNKNANLSAYQFLAAALVAAEENWPDQDEPRSDGYVLAYPGCPDEWRVKPEDLGGKQEGDVSDD